MKYLVISILLIMSSSSIADTSLEQERLSQLAQELELIRDLAKSTRDEIKGRDKQKIKFQYDVLIETLSSLEFGVYQHINLQNQSPRDHWDLGVVAEKDKEQK